jgi:hypothetical protein
MPWAVDVNVTFPAPESTRTEPSVSVSKTRTLGSAGGPAHAAVGPRTQRIEPKSESQTRPNLVSTPIACGDIARTPRPVKVFG